MTPEEQAEELARRQRQYDNETVKIEMRERIKKAEAWAESKRIQRLLDDYDAAHKP